MRVPTLSAGSSAVKGAILDGRDRTTMAPGADEWEAAAPARREEQLRTRLRRHGDFDVVGHRIVHGGQRFVESVVVDPETRAGLAELPETRHNLLLARSDRP